MQLQAYQPRIPGVTKGASAASAQLPALKRALAIADPDEKAKALTDIATKWFRAHRWYYGETVECRAAYYGDVWGYWDDVVGRYISNPEPRSSDEIRAEITAIRPVTDQATGIITQEEPIFDVSAASSEGRDSAAQKAGHAILEHAWRQHRGRSMYRVTGRNGYRDGTTFVHLAWDAAAGPPVSPDEMLAQAAQAAGAVTPNAGDWRFSLVAPHDVAYDPCSTTPYDGEAVLIREKWTRGKLKDTYPDRWTEPLSGPRDDDVDRTRAEEAAKYSPVAGRQSEAENDDETVDVYTMYVRRCPEYPRGLHIVFGGEKMLAGERNEIENPICPKEGEPSGSWPKSPWPLFAARCDERDGVPWGCGRVVHMIGVQRYFNAMWGMRLEHNSRVALAKIILPKALDVEWTDEIGQEIRINRTIDPRQIAYVNPPNVPQDYNVAIQDLKVELEYIGGVSASTNGQVPFADTSGRAMVQAQERDFGRLAPYKSELDAMWGEVMLYALRLFQRHATEARQILVVGENGATSVAYLSRADLTAELDLLIQNDQSIPRESGKRMVWLQGFMQALAQAPDHNTRMALFRMARLKDFEGLLETAMPDMTKASRMADRIMLGETTPVLDGDDPLTFKAELERLMKTEEYERRVARERKEQGLSLTEQLATSYWFYYTSKLGTPMPGMPEQPMMGAGAPQAGPPMPAGQPEMMAA